MVEIEEKKRGFSIKAAPKTPAQRMLEDAEGLGLGAQDIARLRSAFTLERGTRAERLQAQAMVDEVKDAIAAGIGESVRLEVARGGRVILPAEGRNRGAGRFVDRDGLISLFESGGLSGYSRQEMDRCPQLRERGLTAATLRLMAGGEYRALVERPSAGVRSQLGAEGPRQPPTSTTAMHRFRLSGVEMSRVLARVEAAVQAADKTGRALKVLREVAGEGATLQSLGGRGRVRDKNRKALILALDVAAEAMGLASARALGRPS